MYAHEDLSGSRDGIGEIFIDKFGRRTIFVKYNCFHNGTSAELRCSVERKCLGRVTGVATETLGANKLSPTVALGEFLQKRETLAAEAPDVGCEDQLRGEAADGTEGEGEADFIPEFRDGSAIGCVRELSEMVVVLKEGEAAAFLGVLEEGFGGEIVLAEAGEVFVGRDEAGDEGVVLRRQAELPSAPHDAAVGDDVTGGESVGDAGVGGIHAESLLDERKARGELEETFDGGVDQDGLADGEHASNSMQVRRR
jgi:hypothetical protein